MCVCVDVCAESLIKEPKGPDCISAESKKNPMSVLDMTLNNDSKASVMMDLWGMMSTLNCHCSQVHSGP